MSIFTEFKNYKELIPISCVGLLAGIASYYADDAPKRIIKVIITSSFLTILVFTILTMSDLPYLAKVGIAAGAGYFGIDKSLELIQKLLAFKNRNQSPPIDANTAVKQEDINRLLAEKNQKEKEQK